MRATSKTMKPLPTKADIRAQLEAQIQEYLDTGGQVKPIPRGQSGRQDNQNPFSHYTIERNNQSRTPLTHVVKAMEARKQPSPPEKKRPKKRLITDDFGEPVRWVWDDEA